MKTFSLFSLFLFLLIHGALPGQDYRNIITGGMAFYSGTTNQAGFLSGVRPDSALAQGNGDTLFLAANTIKPMTPPGTLLDTVGGILGRRIMKLNTGWFWFFNALGDTMFLNSAAALNDSRKFTGLPQKGEIRATCTAIRPMTFLGTSDTVKEFTFQAQDSGGVNIANFYNGKIIRLSRQYGFIQVYDLYHFPEATGLFSLEGRTIPPIGFRGLTWHDVYDYDVGDVFHVVTHENYQLTSQHYTTDHKYIRTVKSKQVAPGGGTVTYTFDYCDEETYFSFSSGYVTGYNTGSMEESYPYTYAPASVSGVFVPEIFNKNGCRYFSALHHLIPDVPSSGQNINYYLCCWKPDPNYTTYANEQEYARGLGKVHDKQWMYYNWEVYYNYEDLVYYQKGGQQWGTPLYADCAAMIPTFSVSPASLSLDYPAGSSAVLNISTNRWWNITIPAGSSRFTFSPDGGQGNAAVTVTAKDTNTTGNIIYEEIQLNFYPNHSVGYTVSQQPHSGSWISSAPDTLFLGWQYGSTDTLFIFSNSSWTLFSKGDWPSWASYYHSLAGTGDGMIVLAAISPNQSATVRMLPLSLKSPAGDKDVMLVQLARYGTGIDMKNSPNLNVYPNPVAETAVISFAGYPENAEKQLSLYDLMGRLVFKDSFRNESYIFKRETLAPGIYILKVCCLDDSQVSMFKVVLE